MVNAEDCLEVEWLVACLSPGDIAPHPNFRADSADGAELLALLVRLQWREFDAYRDITEEVNGASTSSPDVKGAALLDSARRALEAETVREGLHDLMVVASDKTLSLGRRGAAALIAAVVGSELDEPEKCLDVILSVVGLLEKSTAGAPTSRQLAIAVLLQQCALRALEAGQVRESRRFAERALSSLVREGADWDDFPVSRGISWSAAETQQRLVELMDGNARSILVATGDMSDEAWVDLVRSPFPAAETRPMRDTLSALSTVIDETFDQHYGSRRIRRNGWEDSVLRLLSSSLLNAELAGDLARVARLRQLVGIVVSLRLQAASDVPTSYKRAVRLLRQSDSDDRLRQLVQAMRMRGPLDVLRDAAETLIETRARQNYVTSTDLTLLNRTADLIHPSYTNGAVDLALRYAGQLRDGRVKGSRVVPWKRLETSIRVTATLVSGNHEADVPYIANSVLGMVANSEFAGNQFVLSALADFCSSLSWEDVPIQIKRGWLSLLDAASESHDVLPLDLMRGYVALGTDDQTEIRERLSGLQFVAALVGGLLDEGTSRTDDVDHAVEIVTDIIEEMRQNAARGTFSGYSWSPFEMAAYLITKLGREDVLSALLMGISDPNVASNDKMDGLRVLTDEAPSVRLTSEAADYLTFHPIPPSSGAQDGFFTVPPEHFEAACRNFHLAYGVSLPDQVQQDVLRDAGAEDATLRAEAAKSCWLAGATFPPADWPIVLLLQLSYDQDPSVRNSASRSLGYLSVFPRTALLQTIAGRVELMLSEPGIAITIGALNGLAAAARQRECAARPLWCREAVRTLVSSHASRNVREGAQAVLSLYA